MPFHVFSITSPVGLQFKFCKEWQNPQSMLSTNFIILEFVLLKDSQAVKTTGGPVCAWDTVVFTPLPESRRKVWPLVITSSQK
jgi:hypothetical protein